MLPLRIRSFLPPLILLPLAALLLAQGPETGRLFKDLEEQPGGTNPAFLRGFIPTPEQTFFIMHLAVAPCSALQAGASCPVSSPAGG